jgi:hypothetical protein
MLSLSPPAVVSRKFVRLMPSTRVVRLGTPAAPESCCAPYTT